MSRMSQEVVDATASLCGLLSDLGFVYEWEGDNRGGSRSRYIYVRKPVQMKIRISDHGSDRIERDKKYSRVIALDVRVDDLLSLPNAIAVIKEKASPTLPQAEK